MIKVRLYKEDDSLLERAISALTNRLYFKASVILYSSIEITASRYEIDTKQSGDTNPGVSYGAVDKVYKSKYVEFIFKLSDKGKEQISNYYRETKDKEYSYLQELGFNTKNGISSTMYIIDILKHIGVLNKNNTKDTFLDGTLKTTDELYFHLITLIGRTGHV